MKAVRNEKAVTLIEVLVAMTILSIILISIMNIFPQMGMMNQHNEEKTQAVNLAKQYLNKWKEKGEIPSNYIDEKDGFYIYEEIDPEHEFVVVIKIKNTSDSSIIDARQIHIQIKNKNKRDVSETYGYMMID